MINYIYDTQRYRQNTEFYRYESMDKNFQVILLQKKTEQKVIKVLLFSFGRRQGNQNQKSTN